MNDQAQALRDKVNKKKMKIITVTSGKGKSNFTTNTAIALKEQGKKPLIVDADFGLANVEIILGARPQHNLAHLINKSCSIEEIITLSPQGIPFISGGSGIKEMLFLDKKQIEEIGNQLSRIEQMADVLLVDTGAGINDIVLKFSEMADEVYIVVTPEPASITDAYALIKTLVKDFQIKPQITMVINKVVSETEAKDVFRKMMYVTEHFLQLKIAYGGYIPHDDVLFEAVKNQEPVTKYDPKAKSSQAYRKIANEIINGAETIAKVEKVNWVNRFKNIFSKDI